MDLLRHLGDFMWHISPALVSVVIGAFTIQMYFIRRANASAFVDAIVKDLETIKTDALEYWNIDPKAEGGHGRSGLLEQKLKGAIKGVSADIEYFCKKYKRAEHVVVQNLLIDVAEAVTGGNFESQERSPSPTIYIQIVNSISGLRAKLLMTKF